MISLALFCSSTTSSLTIVALSSLLHHHLSLFPPLLRCKRSKSAMESLSDGLPEQTLAPTKQPGPSDLPIEGCSGPSYGMAEGSERVTAQGEPLVFPIYLDDVAMEAKKTKALTKGWARKRQLVKSNVGVAWREARIYTSECNF